MGIDLNAVTFDGQLTTEMILDRVSDLDIYRYYIGDEAVSLRPINSPLRRDNIPSFSIFYSSRTGRYLFKDFGNGVVGDCFKLVQLLFNLTFPESLEKIAMDLGIITIGDPKFIRKIEDKRLEVLKECGKVSLKIKSKQPTQADKDFWNQFGITGTTLLKYNVKAVEFIFINDKVIKAGSHCYAYLELKDGNPTYKIYQPYNQRYKFMNNNDYSVWEGWTQMPVTGDSLIITSSRKDVMSIVSTTNFNAVALQSEGVFPKPQVIDELKSRFNDIYVFYDNDFKNKENNGRLYGEKLSKEFGLIQIEIPTIYQSKDYSDLVKDYGPITAREVLTTLLFNGKN